MPTSVIGSLSRRFPSLQGVRFIRRNELAAIVIDNDAARAEILLQGAQLIAFTPRNERPLIWNSPLASFRNGASSRGGIPVCWPWFGDAARNPEPLRSQLQGSGLPAHGFARSMDWQLNDIVCTGTGATDVVLSLDVDASTHAAWGFAARLVVRHRIATTLTTTFEVLNRDTRTFHFSAALHSYFAVSTIEAVAVDGFSGHRYVDALDDWNMKQQHGPIVIDREVDRIYLATAARSVIRDAGWQREIVIDAVGAHSAVVWNPWVDKARRLSDFAPDAYRDMLCIETANVLDDIVTLAPGSAHVTGVTIGSRQPLQ